MIKDDALALTRIYTVANRVAKPIQDDRKKIAVVQLIKSHFSLGGRWEKSVVERDLWYFHFSPWQRDNLGSWGSWKIGEKYLVRLLLKIIGVFPFLSYLFCNWEIKNDIDYFYFIFYYVTAIFKTWQNNKFLILNFLLFSLPFSCFFIFLVLFFSSIDPRENNKGVN